MRRILYYSLLCLLLVSVNSCKEDEVSQPPTPTLTVNVTSGLYQSTEFEFTIEQISATSVSLLPYGTEQPNTAGVLVPASAFKDGKAIVKVVYNQVGDFNAVAVANNHTGGGESVKNSISAPVQVHITSDQTLITEFSLNGKVKVNAAGDMVDASSSLVDLTSIKADAPPEKIVYDTTSSPRTIKLTVPYGTDLTKLNAKFTTSDFATVKVGGTVQESESNENDFTSPVTFSVTSLSGEKTTDYVVTVVETPIETKHRFSSLVGVIAEGNEDRDGRILPVSVDTINHVIVFYDTLHAIAGFDPANYKAVELDYGLTGDHAYVRLADNTHLASGDTLDISEPFDLVLVPQDSLGTVDIDYPGGVDEVIDEGAQTYTTSVAEAPQLQVSFDDLNPSPQGTSDADFNIALDVLTGTDVEAINTYYTFSAPAGMTIDNVWANGVDVNDAGGDPVNFKKPVTIAATVTNADGVTFTVLYTVTVTVK